MHGTSSLTQLLLYLINMALLKMMFMWLTILFLLPNRLMHMHTGAASTADPSSGHSHSEFESVTHCPWSQFHALRTYKDEMPGLPGNQWMRENCHIFFTYIDLYDGVRIRRKHEQLAEQSQ